MLFMKREPESISFGMIVHRNTQGQDPQVHIILKRRQAKLSLEPLIAASSSLAIGVTTVRLMQPLLLSQAPLRTKWRSTGDSSKSPKSVKLQHILRDSSYSGPSLVRMFSALASWFTSLRRADR